MPPNIWETQQRAGTTRVQLVIATRHRARSAKQALANEGGRESEAYVGAGAEGVDGGEDVDGDAEERGGGRDDAEAAADDEERVGAGARGSALPRRVPAPAGLRRGRGGRPGRRRRVRHG